jgi:YbgC/YbaW family acyl-CoA thioester hydrolase
MDSSKTQKTFKLSVPLKVRMDDVNYGKHVGHQTYFSFFQEARIAYLAQFGFSELDISGYGMIIAEANCTYKNQLYYGDDITVGCGISVLGPKMFAMDYRISKGDQICALGYTKSLCFDYGSKKVTKLPLEFATAVKAFEGKV